MTAADRRRGLALFHRTEDFEKWVAEWREMQMLFREVEWVKKYEKGVKVVNS